MKNLPYVDVFEVLDEARASFEKALEDAVVVKCSESNEKLGLDSRAGCTFFMTEDSMVVKGNFRTLDYYAGFEYIENDCFEEFLEYRIYDRYSSDRIESCYKRLEEFMMEEEDV